jgi:hypothetical protein
MERCCGAIGRGRASTDRSQEVGLNDPYSYDFAELAPGRGLFFLVTGIHPGVDGTLDRNSARVERPNANPCP